MVKIYCGTNLNLLPCERWPTELPEVPKVGDLIVSSMEWINEDDGIETKSRVCLEVCGIVWVPQITQASTLLNFVWVPEVELELSRKHFKNMVDFYTWYGKITGKGKDYFI